MDRAYKQPDEHSNSDGFPTDKLLAQCGYCADMPDTKPVVAPIEKGTTLVAGDATAVAERPTATKENAQDTKHRVVTDKCGNRSLLDGDNKVLVEQSAYRQMREPKGWQASHHKTDKKLDILERHAVQNVPVEKFLADNPGKVMQLAEGKNPILYAYNHISGETDKGWQLDGINKDGTLRMLKPIRFEVKRTDHKGLIESLDGVSDEFKGKVDKFLEGVTVPPNLCKKLAEAGCKIILTPNMTETFPFLKGERPNGWPAGSTWDAVDAMYNEEASLSLYLADKVLQDGKWNPSRSHDASAVTHELGHAVDNYGPKMIDKTKSTDTYLSDSDGFRKSYEHESAAITSEEDRELIGYFLQPKELGRRETFAELVNYLNGRSTDPRTKVLFEKYFPKTIAETKLLLEQIK